MPYNIDFMSLSSYPTADTRATGEVRVLLDVKNSLHSKHVLIIEDISGFAALQRLVPLSPN